MTDNCEWCPYAVLCRLAPAARGVSPPKLAASDLLIAIANQQLHLFSRRPDRPASACSCHEQSGNKPALMVTDLGFQCPHVATYDDYSHAMTVPVASISEVRMTYRTASALTSNGVATRTRDLVINTTAPSPLMLWIEFEHNLARGWFLEALTASRASGSKWSAFDVEYLDINDACAVDRLLSDSTLPQETHCYRPRPVLPSASSVETPLVFLREAWRHLVYEKIKLALQVSQESTRTTGDRDRDRDPIVSCLLFTAMELATRLDEPDLNALTWLTSGFLLSAQYGKSKHRDKQELALNQVLHSLGIARENSLEYLTCLALHCAAELQGDTTQARTYLTEATKLLTTSECCSAMEPSLKMQLHAKLRELVENKKGRPGVQRVHSVLSAVAARNEALMAGKSGSSGDLLTAKAKAQAIAFSLWPHVFGSGVTAAGGNAKSFILSRVNKSRDGRACIVDVLGAHGARKARFRVFFDQTSTSLWLQEHVRKRFVMIWNCRDEEKNSGSAQSIAEPVRVELLYDPQKKELVPALETVLLHKWIPVGNNGDASYVLHAKLGLHVVSSHRTSLVNRGPASIVDPGQNSPTTGDVSANMTVLCSLCGSRIDLDRVEEHSEVCF